jgi:hypothetical protein
MLLNRSDTEIIKLLTNIYKKAKIKKKKVFIYQLEDDTTWNRILLETITIFKDYPISIYKK